jgi:hypothetical protein
MSTEQSSVPDAWEADWESLADVRIPSTYFSRSGTDKIRNPMPLAPRPKRSRQK